MVSSFINLLMLRREVFCRHEREPNKNILFATLIIPWSMQSYLCFAECIRVMFLLCNQNNSLLFTVHTTYSSKQFFPCVVEHQEKGLQLAGPQVYTDQ